MRSHVCLGQFTRKILFHGKTGPAFRFLGTWKPFLLTDTLDLEVKKSIETKWGDKVYGANCPAELGNERKSSASSGRNYYILSMFPYPSGRLHLGHVRVYTLSDVLARFSRLKGHKVVHPMGWDAFGLPAENAARDHGIEPEKWTRENIQYMKDQMIRMGCCFDWESELTTCDSNYYKWTQWLFLKLWENGLAYKKQAYVFWDPVDKTVLAEEQVDSEMKSWRSGVTVEKKLLRQWFVRTTVFAKDLIDSLDTDVVKQGWREIVAMQRSWVGPMHGYFSDCEVTSSNTKTDTLRLWFSSPDHLKIAKFVILRPDHYLVTSSEENVLRTFENGVKQMNFVIKNPMTGTALPVFTSTSMDIPLVPDSSDCRLDECLTEDIYGDIALNEHHMVEIKNIVELSEKCSDMDDTPRGNGNFVYHPASLRLRDWLVSRQRGWGTPIPALNCVDCGHTTMVPFEELPVTSSKTAIQPYSECSNCGSKKLTRETDTLDTFFDSSWYYFRYLDSKNSLKIFEPKLVEPFLPVNIYIGGAEHATLHLYYARFMAHFLKKIGLIPVKETFKRLIPIGVVKGETFVSNKSGQFLQSDQVEENDKKKLAEKETGLLVTKKWEKMSKSKHNGVDPDLIIQQFGIDASRLLSMAEAVPTSPRKWSTENFNGYLKFQQKVWLTIRDFVDGKESEELHATDLDEWQKLEDELFDARNYYLKGVAYNYGKSNQISVVISKLQGLIGSIRTMKNLNFKESIQLERTLGMLIISMYPIMPAFSAQLWNYFRDVANLTETEFDLENEVWCQQWPEVDQNYNLDLIVQLNSTDHSVVKVQRHILDTMDLSLATEYVLEEPELADRLSKDTLKVISFVVQPSYRAVINLRDTTSPISSSTTSSQFPKQSKSKKTKKLKKVEAVEQ